jgi:hypothetical protein
MARRRNVEGCVNAILERENGVEYTRALDRNDITPLQFFSAVKPGLKKIIKLTSGRTRKTLEEIAADEERKRELFRMEPEFLAEQYDAVMAGEQARLYNGTLLHPDNIEELVYYALAKNRPSLASRKRANVVAGIKRLPHNLELYFQDIGLGGVMQQMPRVFGEGRFTSPHFVLEIFDRAYQRKRKDKSLFDLKQKHHLHRWGDNIIAPHKYWQDPINVEGAIYHVLAEKRHSLASKNRKKVIEGIKGMPACLRDYFISLGLGGLMEAAFKGGEKGSPLAVLKAFDRAYMRNTGDRKSLFDLRQRHHLHEWGDNFEAPQSYWKKYSNVETAIYHTLTERRPSLASMDRLKVIHAVRSLPKNLRYYFMSIPGMGSIMLNGLRKRDSAPEALRIYARAYRKDTGNYSLFAKRDGDCLRFDGKNRLIRHAA